MMSAVCFVLFLAMVIGCLAAGRSAAWALLGGLALFWILSLRRGYSNRELWEMAWAKCRKSLIVVSVIALIGVITGLWRVSGTIAVCILKGVELVTPDFFLAAAFLLCAALSYVLGTSYGVSSTMGVILMALARSGGVDPIVTAGAVLSGVYFGDRCSPASSAASLVAAVTDTDLYRNVRQMLRAGLLPTLLALAAYTALSFRHPLAGLDETVLSALTGHFAVGWAALIPAAVMFLLPLCKVPVKLAMAASIAAAAVLAVFMQGFSVWEVLRAAWSGYHPADGELAGILGGGGVTGMASSYAVVLTAGLYSGVLEGAGHLRPFSGRAEALAGRIGRFPAMLAVSTLCSAVFCNQAVASMLGEQLLGRAYDNREELALDIENSGIMTAGLIPWSIACSVPLAMLGADMRALPYAVLLWATPACYLFTKNRFYPQSRCSDT